MYYDVIITLNVQNLSVKCRDYSTFFWSYCKIQISTYDSDVFFFLVKKNLKKIYNFAKKKVAAQKTDFNLKNIFYF